MKLGFMLRRDAVGDVNMKQRAQQEINIEKQNSQKLRRAVKRCKTHDDSGQILQMIPSSNWLLIPPVEGQNSFVEWSEGDCCLAS